MINNKNIKVYFIDMDGTLVDKKHDVSNTNIQQIRKTIKGGQHAVISTGRMDKTVTDIMRRSDIEYAVTGNGAIIIDKKGKVLNEKTITLKQTQQVLSLAKKHNLVMRLDSEKEVYGTFKWTQKKMVKFAKLLPQDNWDFNMKKHYHKIVLWTKSKSTIKKLIVLFKKEVPGTSIVSSMGGWTIEVTNEKATKGIGNAWVAKHLYKVTKKSEMIHIGDTMNDSTTKDVCQLVAMGSATKELKSFAEYVGPKSRKGAVAKILQGQYKKIEN